MLQYLFMALVFFLAGVAPELSGFGVATISMALLPFILPLSVAIPLVAIISVLATGIVALQTKTQGVRKHVQPLLVGSVVGVLLGMLFLKTIDEQLLKTTLSIFLISYAVFGIFFKGHLLPVGNRSGRVIGFVAGFLGASFNVHGPLVGIYSSANDKLNKTQTKDIVATYMFLTGLFTITGHAIFGRITDEVLLYVLFAIPFLSLGLMVGKRSFQKVSVVWIKRGVYFVVLLAGTALLF